jgi:hypothetical protein
MLITDLTLVFPLFQVDEASSVENDTSGEGVTLPMDIEASKDKQSESTATTSMTAGEGESITEENRIAEERRKSPLSELFATAGTSSNTESQNSELLFSE